MRDENKSAWHCPACGHDSNDAGYELVVEDYGSWYCPVCAEDAGKDVILLRGAA